MIDLVSIVAITVASIFCIIINSTNAATWSAQGDALCSFHGGVINSAAALVGWNCSGSPQYIALSNPCYPTSSTWIGVGCDPLQSSSTNAAVLSLSLVGMGLKGTISPQLGQLSNLTSLILSNNTLGGYIPSELSSLWLLSELSVQGNQLIGNIPSELSTLTSLATLSFGSWPEGGNQLTGSVPSQLSTLTNLKVLNLYLNKLSADVNGNPLPPQFRSLQQLTQIDLGSNGMVGTIPSFLCSLQNLGQLVFETNRLHGTIPNCFSNITGNFWKFEANNCELSGTIPSDLGNLQSMIYIHLQDNVFSGSLPGEIASIASLQALTVNNNRMTGSIPSSLCRPSSAPTFSVDVSNNNFSCVPSCLADNSAAIFSSSTPICSSEPPSVSSKHDNLSIGSIVGIAIACVVLIAVAIAVRRKFVRHNQEAMSDLEFGKRLSKDSTYDI